jgi:hypothetical protein
MRRDLRLVSARACDDRPGRQAGRLGLPSVPPLYRGALLSSSAAASEAQAREADQHHCPGSGFGDEGAKAIIVALPV